MNPAVDAWGKNVDAPSVAVIVSLRIRPYLDAVRGMQSYFADHSGMQLEVHFLNPETDEGNQGLAQTLRNDNARLAVAIGPEAMNFLWTELPSTDLKKMYAMVLNPGTVGPQTNPRCGIPLDIPASQQILEFREKLPDLKRIGLLYHPQNNQPFAQAASDAAALHGMDVVQLKVVNLNDMPTVLASHWPDIQALWMIPDRSIISESLIPYIIKEALANDVAVIGYNRFFADSGAAFALVRNYYAIGRQAAEMAEDLSASRYCQVTVPAYEVVLNSEVLNAVGLAYVVEKKGGSGGEEP